ncbi:hypothetical protein AYI70_g1662 [Smittium culicis]|uniref:Uncharacterized protein n=1 Tax=Smittium culicis TaxID=133412 RepID=A0A1R1YBR1_9FUNG|nr:hypothetical protein AYI70_g1662 [Smittium culicis]
MREMGLIINAKSENYISNTNLVHKDHIVLELLIEISKNNFEHKSVLEFAWLILEEHLTLEKTLQNPIIMDEQLVSSLISVYTGIQHFEPKHREELGRSCLVFLQSVGYNVHKDIENYSIDFLKKLLRVHGYVGNRLALDSAKEKIEALNIYNEIKIDLALAYSYCYEIDKSRELYIELSSEKADTNQLSEVCRGLALSYSEIGLVSSATKIWNNFSSLVGPIDYNYLKCSDKRLMLLLYSLSMKSLTPTKIFSENFHNSSTITSIHDYNVKLSKSETLDLLNWSEYSTFDSDEIDFEINLDINLYKESLKTLQAELECIVLSRMLFPEAIQYSLVNSTVNKIKKLSGSLSQNDFELLLWGLALSKSGTYKATYNKALEIINEALEVYKGNLSNKVFIPAMVACLPRTITSLPHESVFTNINVAPYFFPTSMQIFRRNKTHSYNYINQILDLASKFEIKANNDMLLIEMWHLASFNSFGAVTKRYNSLVLNFTIHESIKDKITSPKTKLLLGQNSRAFLHIYAMMARTDKSAQYALNVVYPQMMKQFGEGIFSYKMFLFLLYNCEKSSNPNVALKLLKKAEQLGITLNKDINESLMRCFFSSPHTEFMGISLLEKLASSSSIKNPTFSKYTYYYLIETFTRRSFKFNLVKKIYNMWLKTSIAKDSLSKNFASICDGLKNLDSNKNLLLEYRVLPNSLAISNYSKNEDFETTQSTSNTTTDYNSRMPMSLSTKEVIKSQIQVYSNMETFSTLNITFFETEIGLLLAEAYLRNGDISHANYLVENILTTLTHTEKSFEFNMLWENVANVSGAYWDNFSANKSAEASFNGCFMLLDLFLRRFFYKSVNSYPHNGKSDGISSNVTGFALYHVAKNKKTLSIMPSWNSFLLNIISSLNDKKLNVENGLELKLRKMNYLFVVDYFKSNDLI